MRCINGHDMQFGAKFCHVCGAEGVASSAIPTPPPSGMTPAPPYATYATAVAPTAAFDGFAIAALVLGILGGSILAIIFAIVSLNRIKKARTRGKGMAIAGLVLGILGLIFTILIVIGAVFAARAQDAPTYNSYTPSNSISYNDGWNAAKEYWNTNDELAYCDTIYNDTDWIPYGDNESAVTDGCNAWNDADGTPGFRTPSNY